MKFILALLFAALLLGQAFGQNAEPIKTSANGVEFHYIEKGQGEPPVHQLIRDLHGGEAVYRDFIDALKPVGEEFKKGNDRAAMSIFNGILGRAFDKLPPAAVESIMQNAPAIRALLLSPEPFPPIPKDKLRRLKIPVLIVTGKNTVKIHKLVNEELFRLLPNAKESLIPNAGHGSPRENPQFFNEAVMNFLTNISTTTGNMKTSSKKESLARDDF